MKYLFLLCLVSCGLDSSKSCKVLTEPKFKYGQNVVVKSGFYGKTKGIIYNTSPTYLTISNQLCLANVYSIYLSPLEDKIYVIENNLELVNNE